MNNTKKKKRGQSTRQLMGLEEITDYSLKTAGGELVYFLVKPDNLSVLSMEGVRGRVIALENLLRGTESVRILALNSRESFERNKDWYAERIQHDQNPALCNLLRQDAQHLDDIQATTASTREFAFLFQLEKRSGEDVRSQIARMERRCATRASTSRGPASRTLNACSRSTISRTCSRNILTISTVKGG